jgi:hypothetical protein
MNLAARLTPVTGSGEEAVRAGALAFAERRRSKAARWLAPTALDRRTFEAVLTSEQPSCITSEFSGGRRPSDGTTGYVAHQQPFCEVGLRVTAPVLRLMLTFEPSASVSSSMPVRGSNTG